MAETWTRRMWSQHKVSQRLAVAPKDSRDCESARRLDSSSWPGPVCVGIFLISAEDLPRGYAFKERTPMTLPVAPRVVLRFSAVRELDSSALRARAD